MITKIITITAFLMLSVSAVAAEPALPPEMKGQWGMNNRSVEIKLIEMQSPTKARLNVVFWDGCTRRGETTAELKAGAWEFIAPGGMRCDDIAVKIAPVTGKNRFEGTIQTGGNPKSPIVLEW